MIQIDNDIKNQTIKNVYLLYGDEGFLIRQYKDKLLGALVTPSDTMNYSKFEGENISVNELIDLSETMPFLAPYRVILVNGSMLFKKGGDELADYLSQVPETTVLIFTEKEVDKRSRAYKAAKDAGRAVEFVTPDEATVRTWLRSRVKKEGKQMSEDVISYFLQVTGADMNTMATELEKLICYAYDRESITSADVDAICTHQISGKIFDMVDAVARGQQDAALKMYGDLLVLREPAMRILALISRQFNNLLQVKQLKKRRVNDKEIASKVGIPPFVVSKYASLSERFSEAKLVAALEECARSEERFKTGQMSDTLAVELLIVKYSRHNS